MRAVGSARRDARSPGPPGGRRCAGSRVASSSWRLYSESPSARSQRVGVERQLAPAAEAELHELLVDVDEVLGRRDVVVDEHHPIGQRVGHPRRARSDREMVNQDVVGMARIRQVAIIQRQILEPRVSGLDEDLRLVAGTAQHALDAQHFVTDRIAVAERGEHLMDGGLHVSARLRRCGGGRGPSPVASAPFDGPVLRPLAVAAAGPDARSEGPRRSRMSSPLPPVALIRGRDRAAPSRTSRGGCGAGRSLASGRLRAEAARHRRRAPASAAARRTIRASAPSSGAGSFDSCSSMSRYFCSITGHA